MKGVRVVQHHDWCPARRCAGSFPFHHRTPHRNEALWNSAWLDFPSKRELTSTELPLNNLDFADDIVLFKMRILDPSVISELSSLALRPQASTGLARKCHVPRRRQTDQDLCYIQSWAEESAREDDQQSCTTNSQPY